MVLEPVQFFVTAEKTAYRVSSNVVYKLGEILKNIVMIHNYIGKHGLKHNQSEIKRYRDSKATKQNVMRNDLLLKKYIINKVYNKTALQMVFESATIHAQH